MSPSKPDVSDPWISSATDWPLDLLLELKGATRIAVVIPTRNEERTIGGVVRLILDELNTLVDEVVVMDSLSTDQSAIIAAEAGARVYSVGEVRPDLGIRAGKGEALWKSQFVTNADVTAFIDADLTEWGPHFLRGVIGPLLADPQVQLCRGFYDRILDVDGLVTLEGGRVTELVARPWLALFRPELSEMVQPLAGSGRSAGTCFPHCRSRRVTVWRSPPCLTSMPDSEFGQSLRLTLGGAPTDTRTFTILEPWP